MKNFNWRFYWSGLITIVLYLIINDFVWDLNHHLLLGIAVYVVIYIPVTVIYDYCFHHFYKRKHQG
ncbi:hypothetical protein H7198_04070 [Fructobacillus sp. CRL 2054]|uniref:hypothetical protein n=1 Tax=Fructobacillus sp. CRL 2054 TaxID=2763007 RepID=UPI002377FDE1|nr:hypothetical protein [Fructobacillus sp. CRL 2054]MDD9138780.1 hypothetical protein [Fructobacillus sp. CRL 2054]